ncbi:hypothetical protein M378DRAFT_492062 [Amanita muscaria Koide BX008]|uniref:Uncharacterized protein n=1 Tax=Amanita muscaria (strain Koide BX008) TaxID=946122 RepID=A0A0C2TU36_AMAMK|nr:hypothetical protein M378DRAFT_492062 [Amanita muscaria Koide BX008]
MSNVPVQLATSVFFGSNIATVALSPRLIQSTFNPNRFILLLLFGPLFGLILIFRRYSGRSHQIEPWAAPRIRYYGCPL